ncbi:hypothetical protein GGI07_005959, partial [Coemansia sp. Benny D115]
MGQQSTAMTQNQLWQGMLTWESTLSGNIKHELNCNIVANADPRITYTAQGLKLHDWPDKMRVNVIIHASEQFAEYCIRSGIQMVQLAAHPASSSDQIKYFEDFSNTLREKSLYALVCIGAQP